MKVTKFIMYTYTCYIHFRKRKYAGMSLLIY